LNTRSKTLIFLTWCCLVSGLAAAEQGAPPPTRATAQSEAGEPRADTSNSGAAPESTRAPAAPVAAGTTAGVSAAAAAPAGVTAPAAAPAGRASSHAAAPNQKSASKTDRLELGTATVTGDREQPKVMYIVPWKRSEIGDLAGKPMNSLVDEVLAPIDRDVFRREVVYYRAVQADASQNAAPLKPAPQGEK